MVRAAAPHLGRGSSVINVSTIFSRTKYYGRSAYVMPKAALNALSKQLALQLGAKGIRVNTVYPGPIEGPRIRNVFSAMDKVRNTPQGTTTNDFLSVMALSRRDEASGEEYTFPTIDDVANSIVFLGSDESRAFSAQGFEVLQGQASVRRDATDWGATWAEDALWRIESRRALRPLGFSRRGSECVARCWASSTVAWRWPTRATCPATSASARCSARLRLKPARRS